MPRTFSKANILRITFNLNCITRESVFFKKCLHRRGWWGGGEVLSYMSYIGMCGPKRYGFSAVLVINIKWGIDFIEFGHFGHK